MNLRLTAIVCSIVLLSACGGGDPPAAPTSSDAALPETVAGDGATGVRECDEFLERYEACLSQVPPEARGGMQAALETWRATWTTMARSPTTRGNLAPICARTAENAMAALAQYDCPD